MTQAKQGGGFFLGMFGFISLVFITMLVLAYHFAKKANPVILDDQGRPQQTQHS